MQSWFLGKTQLFLEKDRKVMYNIMQNLRQGIPLRG